MVVLPAPLGPTSATSWPGPALRLTPASRAFSTCMCVVCGLMTCSFSAGSTGVDPEQFEEPGLQGRGSWDLGRSGSTGGHEPQAGQGGEDEPSGGLCCLPCP